MSEIHIGGYYPGVIGKITEIHAVYYHEHWGFDVSFESQVGRELSIFVNEFDEERDGLWVATAGGKFAGSVAQLGFPTSDQQLRRVYPAQHQLSSCDASSSVVGAYHQGYELAGLDAAVVGTGHTLAVFDA